MSKPTRNAYDYFKHKNSRMDPKTDRTSKKYLRCKEAVRRYGVSRTTIMRWALNSGSLLKVNGTVLIDSETIENFLEGYRIPGELY